ncbi:putative enoyl- hydratase isomerase [Rosellinia necatrix]|uniref:Putative enoyl-hydratase isomerase n=1 Tax=Rosellinia necatrix TaxID=77044 RepID=A0A1W2TH22_ROSNE|nr:putative enoyl- hydratase isomerase [Rosellinia necatrix]
MADVIKVSYSGRIATITIDNDKKLNALNMEGYYNISKALREIALRDDIFITILTGKGRYFSAGADVSVGRDLAPDADPYREWLTSFVANNLNVTQAFYTHPKILIAALNGPVIGLSAALSAFADFVYAAPHTFLLTPFTSIGLVAEGGASHALVRRLGVAKANEALIMSRRIPADELLAAGFVNRVFPCAPGDDAAFMRQVLAEVDDRLGDHLIGDSMTGVKALIRRPERDLLDNQNVAEVFAGLDRFVRGIPQAEFKKLASGQKRHKL